MRVSIVMPVYNGEKYLRESIESIINQTFTDWEFIIINEYGSNDTTTAILQEYAEKDARIVLIQNEQRMGISASMNVGINQAKGEYIARMDGDDVSLPRRIEKQVFFMDENPDVGMCGVKVREFGTKEIGWLLETDEDQLSSDMLFYSPCVHPTVMFRKAVLDKYEFRYNESFLASEDYELFSRLSDVSKVANLDEVLFKYRIIETNTTFKVNDKGIPLYSQVIAENIKKIGLNFSEEEIGLLSPHVSVKQAKGDEVYAKLMKLDLLLKKILVANEAKKFYSKYTLSYTLHKRFREACQTTSWFCKDFDPDKVKMIYSSSLFSHEHFCTGYRIPTDYVPVVTILMPTYNSEAYIAESVMSVLEQSYEDFEFLVINEFGSDDDTIAILNMFEDERIRIIQNTKKLGLADSLNLGIKEARGKYIARLDADDLCAPDRLQLQIDFMEKNPDYGVCGGWQHHFGVKTDFVHKPPTTHEELKAHFMFRCELCHSTLMLRKSSFIDNNLFYDKNYAAEDYELWTRAVHIIKFANIPQVLGEYRIGENNITLSKMGELHYESGEIAARNISLHLNVNVPESHIKYFGNWYNEFNNIKNRNEYINEMQVERKILADIWSSNERLHVYDSTDLLYVLNQRWRWINNSWRHGTVIKDVVDMTTLLDNGINRSYVKTQVIRVGKRLKKYIKGGIKFFFRPIYRPVWHRILGQFNQLRRQMWDLDGHLWDRKNEIAQQIQELQQTIDTLAVQVEQVQLLDKRIGEIEKSFVCVLESEKELSLTLDNRIWKSEESVKQALDGRIWKSETIIQSKIEKLSMIEKYLTDERSDFLLINDTFNTFHFGCTGTSLAIRSRLQKQGSVLSVSWEAIKEPQVVPSNYEEFTSYEFLQKWIDEYYWLAEMIRRCGCVVINGEGSMSRRHAGTLFLLYVIYFSSVHAKKQVSVINHSIYPIVEADGMDEETQKDFIKMIQGAYIHLNKCYVREHLSLHSLNQWLPNVGIQSFDCLPLYIRDFYPYYGEKKDRERLVISGGNNLPAWYVEFVERLLFEIDYETVSFLFSDIRYSEYSSDMEIYNRLKERLGDRITLEAARTTDEWLQSIHTAALFVSGRFHHTIASYMLDTPFIAFNTDTNKMKGMLEMVDAEERLLNSVDLEEAIHQAVKLWKDMQESPNESLHTRKEEIISLAEKNFENIFY